MRTLLIDGDILIYKIATLNEEPTHWGEGLWTLHCDENICKAEAIDVKNITTNKAGKSLLILLL